MKKLKIKWFYKGHRVFKFYRHSLYYYILAVILLPLLLFIALNILSGDYTMQMLGNLLLNSLAKGIFISVIIAGASIPFLCYLYNMQKLCRMIFDSLYYILEGKEIDGDIVSSRKNITYYPKVYYQKKHDNVYITFKLDGSRYQAEFLKKEEDLENMFDMEIIGRNKKLWYITYTFSNVKEHRLDIRDISMNKKYHIPLMKNFDWNYAKVPHALITGKPGGGKTYFMLYLLRYLIKDGAETYIIDPKKSDLYGFRKMLGKKRVMSEPGEVLPMLRDLVEVMDERYEFMANHEKYKSGEDFTYYGLSGIFILFDEIIAFIESLNRNDKTQIMALITQFVLKGRQAGIELIMATQRADATYLPGAIRDSLGLRISLGSLEREGYRMTFGNVDRYLEKREPGHGYIWMDGYLQSVRAFSAPLIPSNYNLRGEIEMLLKDAGNNKDSS